MGKVTYRPGKGQNKIDERKKTLIDQQADSNIEEENRVEQDIDRENEEYMEVEYEEGQEEIEDTAFSQEELPKLSIHSYGENLAHIDNAKIIGELSSDYHVYIEDYVYTYIYQLAASDFTRESSAALVGQSFEDSKEIVIKGMIPINMDRLRRESEWIDMDVMEEAENERKSYFKDQQIIGWLHMQPGYGTMLTMREVKEHENVFEGNGSICMLIDAINKIETLFVYENGELKEQSGYCMYYERNEQMQQYMLDHPFSAGEKEQIKDKVVNQFREIGKMRKEEYTQRKNLNLTVMVASVILIALTAVIVKMNNNKQPIIPTTNKIQVGSQNVGQEVPNQISSAEVETITPTVANPDETSDKPKKENVESESTTSTKNDVAEVVEDNKEEQPQEALNSSKVEEENEDYDIYIVKAGDTLADICYKQYGSAKRSAEVAKFNGLKDTNSVYIGEELKLPK